MDRIISGNGARAVITVFGAVWITLFGAGALMVCISVKFPFSLLFPLAWIIMTFIIIRLFINASRKVVITDSALSIKAFKKEIVIPFDRIKSVSGGRWDHTGPSARYITIEYNDDSTFSKSIKFAPKLDGYKWKKEHKIVHELRAIINKQQNEA